MCEEVRNLVSAFPRVEVLFLPNLNLQVMKEISKIESLRELYITKNSFSTNALKELPPKLDVLVLESAQSIKNNSSYDSLPVTLKELVIKSHANFGSQVCKALPETLLELVLANSSVSLEMLPHLPSKLRKLEYVNCSLNDKLQPGWKFPDSLKEIVMNNCHWLPQNFSCECLPKGLEVLNLDQNSINSFQGKFPDSLKVLTLRENGHHFASSFLQCLPKGLEALYVPGLQINANEILFWPPSLKTLDLRSNGVYVTVDFVSSLPPKLSSLKINVNLTDTEAASSMISKLPPSLQSLTLVLFGESTNFKQIISNLPKSVSLLSIFNYYCLSANDFMSIPDTIATLKLKKSAYYWGYKLMDFSMLPGSIRVLHLDSPDDNCFSNGLPPNLREITLSTQRTGFTRRRRYGWHDRTTVGQQFLNSLQPLLALEKVVIVNYTLPAGYDQFLPPNAEIYTISN